MKPAPITVFIVDDHPLFRQGLRQLIEADPRFKLEGEASDGEAALTGIVSRHPQVAVLDVSLPKLSGLEVARQLQTRQARTGVVILTMHKEEETFNRAMDLGVLGFVLKENATQDILNCLLAVAAGEHYLSPSISSYLMRRRDRTEALAARSPGLGDLTKAERRVLKLIGDKKSSREIAAELYVSVRTVEAHRANISSKLGLHGTHGLLLFAIENRGLL